ncbi:COMM domain-containing protein 2 isoform X1 [Nyctibius grandis]
MIPPVLWQRRTSPFCSWILCAYFIERILPEISTCQLGRTFTRTCGTAGKSSRLPVSWKSSALPEEKVLLRSAVGELGRLAVELLRRGAAPRACEATARKLNIGVDTVQHGVEGLTYLLTESSKLMISEIDFQDSINVLGFSDELNKLLLQLYLENRKEIRTVLSELAPKLPSYHSLEWRLDVQLASRSLRQQIKPAVTIKLHLNQNEDQTAQVLQTDPSTLLHLIQQLEQALGEMKTNHCRRIVRNMK